MVLLMLGTPHALFSRCIFLPKRRSSITILPGALKVVVIIVSRICADNTNRLRCKTKKYVSWRYIPFSLCSLEVVYTTPRIERDLRC